MGGRQSVQQPDCDYGVQGVVQMPVEITQHVNGDAKKIAQKPNGNGTADYGNNGERIGFEKNSKG